jgi:cellulose synthase/poly-beta-1,6-N-acetylglucosamine synthase-like glycosyltransferase
MIREILIYTSIYIGLFLLSFYFLSILFKKEKKFPERELGKVSIIIPAYNEEKTIKQTIESALGLDYPKGKFEIIVIDDGSKDNTLKIASKFKGENIKVFTKENGGKASAINFGLKRANGEFVVTMDADTFVQPDALKKLIRCFDNPKVMSATPGMLVKKANGVLQWVQQIEYLMGIFLRKSFSSINSIHITPGAFSAYRKSFFDKYGGFQEGNITEDLEIALRIQSKNYVIANDPSAVVYTVAPKKFLSLMIQRRRWYSGLMKNLWNYRHLFNKKYGDLGIVVLPAAAITIFLTIVLTFYTVIESVLQIIREVNNIKSVNLNFLYLIDFNKYIFDRFVLLVFSNPLFILGIIFIISLTLYLIYGKIRTRYPNRVTFASALFIALYALFFTFWWVVSIFYVVLGKKIEWRQKTYKK